jgi:hypothetical protein
MGVAPQAREPIGGQMSVHALVEEIRHRLVVKMNGDGTDPLMDRDKVLDVQEIIGRSKTEAADLRGACMAKVLKL